MLIRTYPLTCLHDHTSRPHAHEWDQLTYALSGAMLLHTEAATWLVPPHRAVWVPAGVVHVEELRAPVSVRSLYVVPALAKALPRSVCTVNVTPLLRELIQRITRIGALDQKERAQKNLLDVLLDELLEVPDVPLQLPALRDSRAKRLADALRASPDDDVSIETLSRRAGASRRTMERLFLAETTMTVDEWRRRLRLLRGIELMARGESVTNAALSAGYASTSAFIAVFRRTFGTTPGRYAIG